MSFRIENFGALSLGNHQTLMADGTVVGAPFPYFYQTTDTDAEVTSPEYFAQLSSTLTVNDIIYIVTPTSYIWYRVLAVDPDTRNVAIGYDPYIGPVPLTIPDGGTNATSMSNTNGVAFFDGTKISTISPGTSGQILSSNGPGAAPSYTNVPGVSSLNTFTGALSVIAGTGISITSTSPNISVANTGLLSFGGNSGAVQTGAISLVTSNTNLKFASTGTPGQILFNFEFGTSTFLCSEPLFSTGADNYSFGRSACLSLTSGYQNIAIGTDALRFCSIGYDNLSIGKNSLRALTTGFNNIALGDNILSSALVTTDNIGLGHYCLNSLTSGSGNIAIGDRAGQFLVSGAGNVLIGPTAGYSYTSNETNNLNIGAAYGFAGDNGTIRIGLFVHSTCYIAGIYGVNVGSTATVATVVSNGQFGTANIVGGANVTVSASANTITISSSGGGLAASVITSSQALLVNKIYLCNSASTLSLSLPATSIVGDVIEVTGINTGTLNSWTITQGASQQIFGGTAGTTSGVSGSLFSTASRDAVRLICTVANLTWQVLSSIGNLNYI